MIMRYILFLLAWFVLGWSMATGGWDFKNWRYWTVIAAVAVIHIVGVAYGAE